MLNVIHSYLSVTCVGKYVELKSLVFRCMTPRDLSLRKFLHASSAQLCNGFLLLEILVGLFIMASVSGVIAVYHMHCARQQWHVRMQTQALTALDETMEHLVHNNDGVVQDAVTVMTEIVEPSIVDKEAWLTRPVPCKQHTIIVTCQSIGGERKIQLVSAE